MENKPYHHLNGGTFRNPEGSPVRDSSLTGVSKFLIKRKENLIQMFQKIT